MKKKVLIIDNSPLSRDFYKKKLQEEEQLEVIFSQEKRDAFTRARTSLPNLIILDMDSNSSADMKFLEEKIEDSNTADIPVIVTGPTQDKAYISTLAKYRVIKYFAKPIQFDILFSSIGKVLGVPLSMDDTPCVLDLHRNGDIIFIELALGLNREKIALLQYKLTEIIEKEELDTPKVIILLTNLELTFVDGYNLESLIDNVLACPRINNKRVKILSLSPYVKELLSGHENYEGIEMATNLPKVLTSLVDTTITSSVSDLITDKILTSSVDSDTSSGTVATRFLADATKQKSISDQDGTILNVAIIDSDIKSLGETKAAFASMGANVTCFVNGSGFLDSYKDDKYSFIIIDVLKCDKKAKEILETLKGMPKAPPILIYTQPLPKDTIKLIMSWGAKAYLIKPAKPNDLIQRSLDMLGTENF